MLVYFYATLIYASVNLHLYCVYAMFVYLVFIYTMSIVCPHAMLSLDYTYIYTLYFQK